MAESVLNERNQLKENRENLIAEYYGVSSDVVKDLSAIPYGEVRKALCQSEKIDPYIFRTMLDYSRYFEANLLIAALVDLQVSIQNLRVLDFGCLVCDYGISFARLGAAVTAYDKDYALQFVKYRFAKEHLKVNIVQYPQNYRILTSRHDVVVFGEVLEHLADPYLLLSICKEHGIPHLFTSCYPFGEESYFETPGHSKSAQAQQDDCIDLLRKHYSEQILAKKARLWTLKK